MKSTITKLFLILVIVMSFVAVQSVSAEPFVEGTIDEISTRPNMVVVDDGTDDGTEVYGVRFKYLSNQHNIVLYVDMYVYFEVYEYECPDGTTKLKACEIAVEKDEWIPLRDCQ